MNWGVISIDPRDVMSKYFYSDMDCCLLQTRFVDYNYKKFIQLVLHEGPHHDVCLDLLEIECKPIQIFYMIICIILTKFSNLNNPLAKTCNSKMDSIKQRGLMVNIGSFGENIYFYMF